MTNPYRNRPEFAFWASGVARQAYGLDPVVSSPFVMTQADKIATAGSCFAQHISRTLIQHGLIHFVTEHFQSRPGTVDEGYHVFPARFGNIYTSRQLRQLFDRAYGFFKPKQDWWTGKRGGFLDPFRPRIQEGGFSSVDLLRADRERHFTAVRRMFDECSVFIFTLGLTEAWISPVDGSAFPLAPGVVANDSHDDDAVFHNFGIADVIADLESFHEKLWTVNPRAKVILTVSPVPLIATFEDRHVLVSTVASKSILRAAADEICRRHHPRVAYFPSYEIITGPQTASRYYRDDLREVSEEGVDFVMSVFGRHYLPMEQVDNLEPVQEAAIGPTGAMTELTENDIARMSAVAAIICDEEEIMRL